jgi:hypothetical protein
MQRSMFGDSGLPRSIATKTNESTMTAHAMNIITPLHCFPTINLALSGWV